LEQGIKGYSDISESESESGESDNDIVANAFISESETSERESDVSDHVAVTLPTKRSSTVKYVTGSGLKTLICQ
jgi:hypothetical protein